MVVHSPDKFEVQRAAAVAAQQGNAGTVPPAVLAAGAAEANVAAEVDTGDLLGDATTVHDWDQPPDRRVQVDVHAARGGEEQNINVTTRRGQVLAPDLRARADEDKISIAGSVSDVTPPPNHGTHPQLNPFTPEWFAQLVGAAANAAATAAATAVAGNQRPAPPHNPAAPRRLNDRKVPDFWEDRPEYWFRIFDAHLAHFNPSEEHSFDALLPLLTSAARSTVHSVIRTPGQTPYSKAREALLLHFGRTPRQNARELRETRSMGDRLPSEFLDHVLGLLPDVKTYFEIILLDALPPNARVAALQHTDLRAMARAADAVVLENRAEAEASQPVPAINAISLLDDDVVGGSPIPPPLTPTVAAVARDPRARKSDSLCPTHARWGKKAYKCQSPSTCRMSRVIFPKPAANTTTAASGNGKAGGQ